LQFCLPNSQLAVSRQAWEGRDRQRKRNKERQREKRWKWGQLCAREQSSSRRQGEKIKNLY